LRIRGLVEKVKNNKKKIYEYTATTDLLRHLGVSKVEDLPDYKKIRDVLNKFESSGVVEEE
jgi:chromosome segregation and condensation protein ScpB